MLRQAINPRLLSRSLRESGFARGARFNSALGRSSVSPNTSKFLAATGAAGLGCSFVLTVARGKLANCEEIAPVGPGSIEGKVVVKIDAEVLESLPLMTLSDVEAQTGRWVDGHERLYVTYEGIVYDVTHFALEHPGGRDLLLTAAGLDLQHFFDNYKVHGQTQKAANWLAPLAVGKLSLEDAARARAKSTPDAHVKKRMRMLSRARVKVLLVAGSLPVWIAVRYFVRCIGFVLPPLGRLLARCLPVTVPGLSDGAGAAPEGGSVAVIGGGIAGCGAAWSLARSGYDVTVFEARENTSGNARTFDWDGFSGGGEVKSCVSVTAWVPGWYKHYTALLETLGVETTPMPLSWCVHSKVPGHEGTLWAADPRPHEGSLRTHFAKDFQRYSWVVWLVDKTTNFLCLSWAPWKWGDAPSMYTNISGFGMLNPFNIYPLYTLCRNAGISEEWWDIVFQPHYTASFLVDELRPFPAVFGPQIETQIPLNPNEKNSWHGTSSKSAQDCKLTTCVTWKDAGNGLRTTFKKLTENVTLKTGTRVREITVLPSGKKLVHDEFDKTIEVDRVVFACPCNAVGNILKSHGKLEDTILSTPVYADDHHPASGHMHAVMHSDGTVIAPELRKEVLTRGSNYVEVTKLSDGSINVENQYNFGVQTPGPGVYDMPLDKKPVMLISHALGEGKSIDPKLVRGTGNHARAHPLYSGWNVMAQLSLRLVQGRDGVYYCSNWTTPGNVHDMSLLSGLVCAGAIGAKYPFPENAEAKKDFDRMRDLMGV